MNIYAHSIPAAAAVVAVTANETRPYNFPLDCNVDLIR